MDRLSRVRHGGHPNLFGGLRRNDAGSGKWQSSSLLPAKQMKVAECHSGGPFKFSRELQREEPEAGAVAQC